jgi:hypothetical protein
MNSDLYTISQTLGQYSNRNNISELSPLHNLLYANKSTYLGSMDRYRQEECQIPVTKYELSKYLDSPYNAVTVFIFDESYENNSPKSQLSEFIITQTDHVYISNNFVATIYYGEYASQLLDEAFSPKAVFSMKSYLLPSR